MPFHLIRPISENFLQSYRNSDNGQFHSPHGLSSKIGVYGMNRNVDNGRERRVCDAFRLAAMPNVVELLDLFEQIVYPLFPVFEFGATKVLEYGATKQGMLSQDQSHDRGLFASVLAACALTSARIRNGTYSGYIPDNTRTVNTPPAVFLNAAKDCLDGDYDKIGAAHIIDHIQAHNLLALHSLQFGSHGDCMQHLGNGYTLMAMFRLHDENAWPPELQELQKQRYRRVYWCTYILDLQSSLVWNCNLQTRTIHALVQYPNGRLDENLLLSAISPHENHLYQPSNWIVGWNFALDLWRIIENILHRIRNKQVNHDRRRNMCNLAFADTSYRINMTQNVLRIYDQLPHHYKHTPAMTGDIRQDIFALQAANIKMILQLIRIMLLLCENDPSGERTCDVVNEALQVLHTIPISYLKLLSTLLAYQLEGIKRILLFVLEGSLTQASCEKIRTALFFMAELMQILENGQRHTSGSTFETRLQIEKLDRQMNDQNRTLF